MLKLIEKCTDGPYICYIRIMSTKNLAKIGSSNYKKLVVL